MIFYKHYIGDFQRDTSHLSLTERGAYLALIHHYYATEKPLPNDHAALCRIAGAIDKSERAAVRTAMAFFTPVESGLMHNRIEAEIENSGRIADKNRDIALAREAKRRAERGERIEHELSTKRARSVQRTEHELSTNQTSDTRQQKQPSSESEVVEIPVGPPKASAANTRGTRIPADWRLTPELKAIAEAVRFETRLPPVNVESEAAKFRDFWSAKSGRDATKLDWNATWRNWIRNARGINGFHAQAQPQSTLIPMGDEAT